MSSMFGSSTQKTEIPKYAEDASKQALGMANARNELGYIPYYGPDVAAFNPMQMNAMQGANTMAQSMGLPTAGLSLMTPQDFGGGVFGHSSQPLYQSNMDSLEAANPELFAALRALTKMTSQEAMMQAPGAAMRGENPFQPGGFAGDGMGPNQGRTGMVGNGDIGRAISDAVGNATGGRFGGAGSSNGGGKGPGSQGSIW
jgi:hypothetical protein